MRAVLAALVLLLAAATAAPAQAQNRFWLQNNSGQAIQSAYVSPSRLSNWGPDILGQGVLPNGQQVWVTPNFGDCVLDVRVRYASGQEETRMGLNACNISRIAFGRGGDGGAGAAIGGGPAGAASSRNPSFSFINQSGQTIRELYVSLSTQSSWGRDRLGNNVINPGQSIWVDLPQGGTCNVDIRVVYMSGAASERRNFATCHLEGVRWR
ncbi:Tat pathway signal protein [Roseomonas sp. OT10]|uniref:Tat pathway signal protein n=1 Tax=Roseomonas cutis TaxID=2897332 RepID=UPI001E4FD84B|nr:Tat pathway signal protein [Roseomonas sp. OT10]UFN51254.1 Tat pathway signal protein [Roseomonas sp. OT10]